MSCRLDVREAILNKIMGKFVKGRDTFEQLSPGVVSIVGGVDNTQSKAKKAIQAKAIAENLARRVADYTDKHVMGWINRTSEYEPYTVTFEVSHAYIEQEYRKLPKEQQTDPADKELSEEYKAVLERNKSKVSSLNKMLMEASPLEFLKFIAEQSYGITSGGAQAEYGGTGTFNIPEIVEIAQKVFPRSDFIKPDYLPAVQPDCE